MIFKASLFSVLTSVWASFARSIFWAFAQTLSLGTARAWFDLSLSFASLSVKWRAKKFVFIIVLIMWSYGVKQKRNILLLQSWALTHRFRSSLCRVFPCFLLRPHPAVIVPSLTKARFTIGDEGTLLGLNTWERVSHRNGRAGTSGYGMMVEICRRKDINIRKGNGKSAVRKDRIPKIDTVIKIKKCLC